MKCDECNVPNAMQLMYFNELCKQSTLLHIMVWVYCNECNVRNAIKRMFCIKCNIRNVMNAMRKCNAINIMQIIECN